VWNTFSRWKPLWWSNDFFVTLLSVPCIVAAITAFWFGVCGFLNCFGHSPRPAAAAATAEKATEKTR